MSHPIRRPEVQADVERKTLALSRDGDGSGQVIVVFDFHKTRETTYRIAVHHGRKDLLRG